MSNDDLYENAEEAINKLFYDTRVSVGQTRDNLETLKMEIDILLDTLGEDDE